MIAKTLLLPGPAGALRLHPPLGFKTLDSRDRFTLQRLPCPTPFCGFVESQHRIHDVIFRYIFIVSVCVSHARSWSSRRRCATRTSTSWVWWRICLSSPTVVWSPERPCVLRPTPPASGHTDQV